ncbi:hypothetical protein ABID95_008023 [Streptomyces atratus]
MRCALVSIGGNTHVRAGAVGVDHLGKWVSAPMVPAEGYV